MTTRRWLLGMMQCSLWAAATAQTAPLTHFNACTADVVNPPYIDRLTVKQPGILFDIVSGAAASAGLEVRFHRLPWRRCLHEVQQGRMDAVFTLTRTPERETQFAFPPLDGYVTETLAGRYVARELGIDAHLSEASVLRTDREHIAFNKAFYQQYCTDIERYWSRLATHQQRVMQTFTQQKPEDQLPATLSGER